MSSLNWSEIAQEWQQAIEYVRPQHSDRVQGLHVAIKLIPYLKESKILNSGILSLSRLSLVINLPNKSTELIITPPGPMFTGSNSEFKLSLYDPKADEVLIGKRTTIKSKNEIVKAAEELFTRLQEDDGIT